MENPLTRRSCFVIAPYEVPIARFLEALRRERIEPFFISDFLKSAGFSISNLRSAFRSVDLVIALIDPRFSLFNVIFEIGVALGVGKPVMIFAETGAELPSDLAGVQVRHIDLSNLNNVVPEILSSLESKKLSQEVLGLTAGRSTPLERVRPRLQGGALRSELDKARNVWAHSSDQSEWETELSRVLGEIGWTVVEARQSVRSGAPDMAIWIDEVQKDIGNPLAVEIKQSLSRGGLEQAQAQLSRHLESVGAKAGVIFYGGPEMSLVKNVVQSSPPIFAFSFDQLADLLENGKFPAALKASVAAARRAG